MSERTNAVQPSGLQQQRKSLAASNQVPSALLVSSVLPASPMKNDHLPNKDDVMVDNDYNNDWQGKDVDAMVIDNISDDAKRALNGNLELFFKSDGISDDFK